jgi:hypothetical protein
MENPTTIAIDLSKGVGVQWELRAVLALGDQWVRRRSRTLSERRDPLQCPSRIFVTALQAAFRIRTRSVLFKRQDRVEPRQAPHPATVRTSRFGRRRPVSRAR